MVALEQTALPQRPIDADPATTELRLARPADPSRVDRVVVAFNCAQQSADPVGAIKEVFELVDISTQKELTDRYFHAVRNVNGVPHWIRYYANERWANRAVSYARERATQLRTFLPPKSKRLNRAEQHAKALAELVKPREDPNGNLVKRQLYQFDPDARYGGHITEVLGSLSGALKKTLVLPGSADSVETVEDRTLPGARALEAEHARLGVYDPIVIWSEYSVPSMQLDLLGNLVQVTFSRVVHFAVRRLGEFISGMPETRCNAVAASLDTAILGMTAAKMPVFHHLFYSASPGPGVSERGQLRNSGDLVVAVSKRDPIAHFARFGTWSARIADRIIEDDTDGHGLPLQPGTKVFSVLSRMTAGVLDPKDLPVIDPIRLQDGFVRSIRDRDFGKAGINVMRGCCTAGRVFVDAAAATQERAGQFVDRAFGRSPVTNAL